MRGALHDPITVGIDIGIILADAGSTLKGMGDVPFGEDHPRGCGEHKVLASRSVMIAGSSSRMRGAQTYPSSTPNSDRIILADAGSTDVQG